MKIIISNVKILISREEILNVVLYLLLGWDVLSFVMEKEYDVIDDV